LRGATAKHRWESPFYGPKPATSPRKQKMRYLRKQKKKKRDAIDYTPSTSTTERARAFSFGRLGSKTAPVQLEKRRTRSVGLDQPEFRGLTAVANQERRRAGRRRRLTG